MGLIIRISSWVEPLKSFFLQIELKKIYKKLPPPDSIRLCLMNNHAVPGIYPLLGAKPKKRMRVFYTKRNTSKISKYLRAYKQLLIPKHLIVEDNGLSFYHLGFHTVCFKPLLLSSFIKNWSNHNYFT